MDGLVQTYQRGHKAVMNTHSVGGLSTRTHYVGMDQYGNKYYEDFNPLCTYSLIQTSRKEDGCSIMTFCCPEVTMVIWFHPSGTDGLLISTMMSQQSKKEASTTHFLKRNMNGTTHTLLSSCTHPECLTSTNEHLILSSIVKTGTPRSGSQPLREHDGDKIAWIKIWWAYQSYQS